MSTVAKKRKSGRGPNPLGPIFRLRGPSRTVLSFLSFGEAGKLRFLTKFWNEEIKLLWTPERIKTEVRRMLNAAHEDLLAELKSPRTFPGFSLRLLPFSLHTYPCGLGKHFVLVL